MQCISSRSGVRCVAMLARCVSVGVRVPWLDGRGGVEVSARLWLGVTPVWTRSGERGHEMGEEMTVG